jgi:hypothetical protein
VNFSLRVLLLSSFAAFGVPTSTSAHAWYPMECCSARDCMPADTIEPDERGDWKVSVGERQIWVPHGFAVRASLDDQIHICFRRDEFGLLMPLCLFLPPKS